jgi:hypothetical protein
MAERQSGLGGFGQDRLRRELGSAQAPAFEQAMYPGSGRGNAPTTITPWQYPDSSRVKAYQYDYGRQQLRVRFHKYGTPWVYNEVPITVYQAFDASPSKGQYINSTLNYTQHRRADPDEVANFFADV